MKKKRAPTTKKLTWKSLSKLLVSDVVRRGGKKTPGMLREAEDVLRAFHRLTGNETDPNCLILNGYHGLDPDES